MSGAFAQRRALRLVSLAAVLGTASLQLAGIAAADTTTGVNENRYSLVAEGDGFFAYVYNGLLPAVPYVDAGAYSSEAENNSQGNSTAFAGLPYAGKTGTTLPGTVNGLSGGNFPPLPPVPGYVSTNFPNVKDSDQSQGPYSIAAHSAEQKSSATAGAGISPNSGAGNQQIFSKANVMANADGSVIASASAGAEAVSVGPVTILNISSSMTITADGKSAPKVKSATNLGTIQILGFKIGVDESGFTVLGDNLPLPTSTILKQVNALLGAQGFQIDVIPGEVSTSKTTGQTTATSSEFRITQSSDVPVLGPTQTIFTFGRAMASVVDVALDNGAVSSGGGDASGSTGGDAGTPDTSGTVAAPGIGSVPTSGEPALQPGSVGAAPALAPDLPVAPPLVTGPVSGRAGLGSGSPRTLGFVVTAPKGTEIWGIYLVLVLAGVGVLGGQQLFRFIGVRLALHPA
jgi:hypothetical protein